MAALAHAREGARRYTALLALPGARRPVIASAIGSMPIGMFGLAILLLAEDATGSFAVAGRVVGAFGIGNAIGAVSQGRLMDRLGQTRVLRTAAVGHAVACCALVAAALSGSGTGVLYACAAAGGLSLPQLPAAMRSLWSVLARDQAQRETAYAMVSIVFEVSVITAPAIAAVIVALASPQAAVLTGAGISAGGALAFAATGASIRWRGEPHEVGWLGPLSAPGMRTVLVVLGAFGTAVGVVQVLLPAFADERGSAETGGLYLALLSAGSLAGGLIYGARSWPGSPVLRLPVLLLALGAGFALLAAATVPAVLGCPAGAERPRARPRDRRRLHPARHRRPARHRHRGVRGDGDGHRRRDRARERARRRDRGGLELRGGRAGRGRDRGDRGGGRDGAPPHARAGVVLQHRDRPLDGRV